MSALRRIRNEAQWDRIARIAVGMILLSLMFIGPETLWGLVGLIPLITGLLGFCPAYRLLGVSTCPTDQRPSSA